MDCTDTTASKNSSFVVSVYVAMGTSLPNRCIETFVSSGSTTPTFRRHVKFYSKVDGRDTETYRQQGELIIRLSFFLNKKIRLNNMQKQ
jgi:hypothetical protein